jgi:hypothetical protein
MFLREQCHFRRIGDFVDAIVDNPIVTLEDGIKGLRAACIWLLDSMESDNHGVKSKFNNEIKSLIMLERKEGVKLSGASSNKQVKCIRLRIF